MLRAVSVFVALALLLASGSAFAVPTRRAPAIRRVSRSIGFPFDGRLRGAVLLRETPELRYTPEYAPRGNFYGTWELVQVLHRASAHVARRVPGAKLSVGELSQATGGSIPGHHSHQNGRDADVSFYILDGAGRPMEPWAFANFDDQGRGEGPNVGLRFDDARNWEFVSRLVTDADARVQFIFIGRGLRHRLIEYANRRGVSPSIVARAARAMVQPAEGHPHRNHFHIRIYCGTANQPQCQDRAPFHPWYRGARR